MVRRTVWRLGTPPISLATVGMPSPTTPTTNACTTWRWRWARRPRPTAVQDTEIIMDDLRQAGRWAADMAADHLAAIPGQPVWRPVAEADRSWLSQQPLPAA